MKAKQYNSYGDVPFYFKQWFFWIMYFFICPPLALFILVFGNVYYKKNGYVEAFGIMNKIVAFFIGIFTCLIWWGKIVVFVTSITSTLFLDDFELKNDILYKNGELHTGIYQSYHENDKLFLEIEYLNGKPHGKSQIFYKTGKKELAGNYLNGKLNGLVISYYHNGKKSREEFYKNGKEVKRLKVWRENGEKIIVAKDNELLLKKDLFVDKSGSLFTGIYQKFYKNGFLMSECNMKKGKKHGLWILNDKTGNTEFESEYKNGLKDGLSQTFYKNGEVKLSGEFKKGQPHGKFEEYNENGKLISVQNIRMEN